jgi:hypothetical protein
MKKLKEILEVIIKVIYIYQELIIKIWFILIWLKLIAKNYNGIGKITYLGN